MAVSLCRILQLTLGSCVNGTNTSSKFSLDIEAHLTRYAYLLVVIEDNDHVAVQEACMVHCLVCHAPCDCPISNHCHAMIFPALQSASDISTRMESISPGMTDTAAKDIHPKEEYYTLKSRATAIPRAAEIEVEECPAPKGSYSLSSLFVKPAQRY